MKKTTVKKQEKAKKPAKTDRQAPKHLNIEIRDNRGKRWGTLQANARVFGTGSIGLYANGKLSNPTGGEPYQIGVSVVLVGSKP